MIADVQTMTFTRTINVSPATLYRSLTNALALREWLCDTAEVNARKDRPLFLVWDQGDFAVGVFTALEKDRLVAFTWRGKDDAETSHVSISLEAQDGGTQITISHEGVDDPASARRIEQLWANGLENLQSVAEVGHDLRITRRPMLGIFLDTLDEKKAADRGIPVSEGILLTGTAEGMGAAAAGLQKDDVIVSFDGKPITDYPSLTRALTGLHGGDMIEVVYYRGAEKRAVQMELTKRPIRDIPPSADALADMIAKQYAELDTELRAIFDGVSDAEATHRPAPNEWSAKETIGHLIGTERWIQEWVGSLLDGEELRSFSSQVFQRQTALAATYPTTADVLAEMKRSQDETVALIRSLPATFVENRGSYFRAGTLILDYAPHSREHFEQMRAAIASARP